MITTIHTALAAKRDQLNKDDKGFTLIELLVVVLIIGILAAIAIPVFLSQQESAKDGGVKSDLANAKIAVIAYATDNPTATTVALTTTALGKYGFTDGGDTTFTTESVNPTTNFTIAASSSTGKTFQITAQGGVTQVSTPAPSGSAG